MATASTPRTPLSRDSASRPSTVPRSRPPATALLLASAALTSALAVGCDGGGSDTGAGGGTTTGTTTTTTTSAGGPTLSLTLRRGPASEIVAAVRATDATGAALTGATITLTAQGGTASAVTEIGGGDYEGTVTPETLDREVDIEAATGGAKVTRTALVFSVIGDGWEQAEVLEGYVNTKGWEDGASVSSDGEWLLVGSYVPTDVLTCNAIGGGDPADPACNVLTGPITAPERPDMLGAERVVSPTKIVNACPSLNFPPGGGELDFAIPLVAAYGFRRQADGSYREPFVIGFDANGCLGPYGISFAGPVSGESTTVLFANDDPLTSRPGESSTDLYWAPLELGKKNILAKYSFDGSKVTATDVLTVPLPLPDLAGTQGNVNFSAGRLWWDDESKEDVDRELYMAEVTGELPGATIAPTQIVGASVPGVENIQPVFDGSTLVWRASPGMLSAELTAGADPSEAASWSAPETVIGALPMPDSLFVAVGEPTVAHIDGETWLYFVYIKKTEAGYDANVARIRRRE